MKPPFPLFDAAFAILVGAASASLESLHEQMAKIESGVIHAYEAYSKQVVLQKLCVSQKFWDKLLDEGLPFTVVGHSRWVTGQALIEHLNRNAKQKGECHKDL